jgi:hypothetical protein
MTIVSLPLASPHIIADRSLFLDRQKSSTGDRTSRLWSDRRFGNLAEEYISRSIVITQLDRKLGKLPAETKKSIAALDIVKLESLTIALLDFGTLA